MEKSLYQVIIGLRNKENDLRSQLEYQRNQLAYIRQQFREEYQKILSDYNNVRNQLSVIEDRFIISPKDFAEILSKWTDKNYKLKVFRETVQKEGEVYYTYNYLICYLNSDNEFYSYENNGKKSGQYINYSIDNKAFEKLMSSLSKTDSYILSSSFDEEFHPTISHSDYIEGINFVKLFTSGYMNNIINFNFQHLIKPMVKSKLEDVFVDENLNVLNTRKNNL